MGHHILFLRFSSRLIISNPSSFEFPFLSLVDKVIQKIGFSFKKPKLEERKGNSKEDGLEIEDEMPDLINNEIDYGDDVNGDDKKVSNAKHTKDSEQVDNGTEIMYSGTTQEDWQRELEKVSMKLKIEYGKINANGASEWREHIQQIKQGGEKFNTAIPESRAVLENLSSEIDKSLEKIIKKEELLIFINLNISIFMFFFIIRNNIFMIFT